MTCMHSFRTAFLPLALAVLPEAFAAPPDAPVAGLAFPEANVIIAQARQGAQLHDMLAELDYDFDLDEASLAFVGSEFGAARDIVKNAPYQAEAVNESVQVLPDGNRIVRRSVTLLARDGYGRTRQEKKREGGSVVYLFDPMTNRSFVLNGERKTAVRVPRVPTPMAGVPPPAPPVAPLPPVPPVPPAPPAAMSAPHASGTVVIQKETKEITVDPEHVVVRKRGDRGEDVRVEVVRIGGEGSGTPMAGMHQGPLVLPLLPSGKGETKSLGTREFDGVKADGTQTTYTIPAGRIGNEKPIVVASERWFSPELHVVVFAKTSDPRAGETTYRLTGLKRGEPPAELFKVPTDFKTRGG